MLGVDGRRDGKPVWSMDRAIGDIRADAAGVSGESQANRVLSWAGKVARGVVYVCFGVPCAILFAVAIFVGGFLPVLPFLLWQRALDRGVLRLIPELSDHEAALSVDQVPREYCKNEWSMNDDKILLTLAVLALAWLTFVFFHDGYETMVLWVYPLFWVAGTILMSLETIPFLFRRRLRRWVLHELCKRGVPICTSCGYSTRGILGNCCPECGTPVMQELSGGEFGDANIGG